MKIAISSTGPDFESEVDPRFGRCQYFLIVDLNDMSFETVANANIGQGSGVGIQSAKVVADKGAKALLTGNVGPNAYQALSAAGLDVITGVSGTVREAAQQYKQGSLKPTRQANVNNGFGTARVQPSSQFTASAQAPLTSFGRGQGMGSGRGMRCGQGIGGGHGMGCGRGIRRVPYTSTAKNPSSKPARQEQLGDLMEHARVLREQMEEIQMRIEELQNEKP